ncbi:unnamed protein product [Rotaria socialis]|uniref:Uncharacterized protein n=1 Tax=Rotaria socialis TaxID=392032 RepID=A0A818A2G0_9BILA|nr:unnamed protein product [Rotaria socialis]CAF4501003.1 unnamed protein product [Rotaria socialis]
MQTFSDEIFLRGFLSNLVLISAHALLNVFTRSESSQFKERCGHSVLLNNNYWVLQQTRHALEAIYKNELTFAALPWNRISMSIQQVYNACLIDDIKYSRERMHVRKATLKAGTLLAKKVKDISYPPR